VSERILVTGATGSVGSNLCVLAAGAGREVRALVRAGTDADVLVAAGCEPVVGDVTDRSSLDEAVRGVSGIVHCAAQIGGSWTTATADDFDRVNFRGAVNVLDAAGAADVGRTVLLMSGVINNGSETATEESRITPIDPRNSPYTRAKLAAYYEGMARAARGMDVNFVVPGGVYGPTPFIERALVPTIFTGTLLMAARGGLKRYLPMPLTWVLAEDVAKVSLGALEQGRAGARYLALGRPEDTCSLPEFCNRFLELAGIDHRVEEFDPQGAGAADDREFGSMLKYMRADHPQPSHDASLTNSELGVEPTSLDAGLRRTLAWLRGHGRMP
jgi:dihydroflavonol-4-reductase